MSFAWQIWSPVFMMPAQTTSETEIGPHEVPVGNTLGRALALYGLIGQVYGGEALHFQLKHPNYAFIGARHQLRRVHLALYKKPKFLDHDKDL